MITESKAAAGTFHSGLPAQITAPPLVVAGEQDPFHTETLFRETAEGIPKARLILYPGMGHPASGKQFGRDVLAFLREGMAEDT